MYTGILRLLLLQIFTLLSLLDVQRMNNNIGQLRASSTYVLRSHINLRGRTIIMPEGVTIDTRGGIFYNGTIIGNNTLVKGDKRIIFGDKITLQGTFEADTAYSEWFHIKNDCKIDNEGGFIRGTDNYQAFRNLFVFNNISISPGSYMLSGRLECKSNQVINGNGATLKFYRKGDCLLIDGNPVQNLTIHNLRIIGSKRDFNDQTEYWHGITIYYAENVTLENLIAESCRGDGIYIGGNQPNGGDDKVPQSIKLSHVKALRNHRQGLSITRCDNVLAEECEFSSTSGTLPYCGVDIEPNNNVEAGWFNECHNIRFVRCKFSNNEGTGLMICGREMSSEITQNQICNVSVENCSFFDNGIIVYGVNGLGIKDCSLKNGEIRMSAQGRIKNVSVENVDVVFHENNNSCGFQLVLMDQECKNISLRNFSASSCGVFGVYITRGTLNDIDGNPLHLLDGLVLSDIVVENCNNSVFVSEYVKNAVYNGITIKDNGIDRNGMKMKSRYGSNLEFIQLDEKTSRRVLK